MLRIWELAFPLSIVLQVSTAKFHSRGPSGTGAAQGGKIDLRKSFQAHTAQRGASTCGGRSLCFLRTLVAEGQAVRDPPSDQI